MADMDTIVNLCKRRGFIFPSSEIYGGLRSTWDYGPLGVELKNNVKRAWWRAVVQKRGDMVGLDAAILMHPRTWEASGHVESFSDPLVECLECHQRWRADQIGEACPNCGNKRFTDPRNFNLMFKTFLGPVEEATAQAWLRPETAQGIFVNFVSVQQTTRKKIPFGIAQIGKAFRNEITPGNFTFRTREFEQMEIEYFVEPGTDEEWHQRWIDERFTWYTSLGMDPANLRQREHAPDELAHYAKRTVDFEYRFPFGEGWGELEGIANRGDFDLTQHAKFSGQEMSFFDQERNERFVPYVIEPSAGADRGTLAFLIDAYKEEEALAASGKMEKRTVLRLHKDLAPMKVAVLPLSRNEQLVPTAREVAESLRDQWMIDYDDAGSIGRRYRRQDEVGTPYCVTVDFDSLEDRAVTIRDRDTMTQDRIPITDLVAYLRDRL